VCCGSRTMTTQPNNNHIVHLFDCRAKLSGGVTCPPEASRVQQAEHNCDGLVVMSEHAGSLSDGANTKCLCTRLRADLLRKMKRGENALL
jgi:hypothetical protein